MAFGKLQSAVRHTFVEARRKWPKEALLASSQAGYCNASNSSPSLLHMRISTRHYFWVTYLPQKKN